jgi:hypothetical protein
MVVSDDPIIAFPHFRMSRKPPPAAKERRRAQPVTKAHPNLKDVRFGVICCGRTVWGEDAGVWEAPRGYWNYVCMPSCDAVKAAPPVGVGKWPQRVKEKA